MKTAKTLYMTAFGTLARTVLAAVLLAAVAIVLTSCACAKEEPASSEPASSSAPKVSVVDKPASSEKASSKPVSSEPAPEPFWMLILGLDSREGTVDSYDGSIPYSDTIMLARIDPVTYHVGIVTIPRDTAAYINGELCKMNDGYHYYEAPGAIQVVKDLTGVEAKYFMTCTFVQFVQFVDAIGGVDAYIPQYLSLKDIVHGDTLEVNAGDQHLDGPHALVAARVRKTYEWEGEAHRQEISREIVCNAIRQVAADPANAAAHVDMLIGNCNTNMPAAELLKLVQDFSAHADQISFVTGTGPFLGGIDARNELYMIPEDPALYAEIVKRIESHQEWQDLVANPF